MAHLHANMDVDYVVTYRFTDTSIHMISMVSAGTNLYLGKTEAQAGFEKLIRALARLGLTIEVRSGDNCCLLVLVRANDDRQFNNVVYRSRYGRV